MKRTVLSVFSLLLFSHSVFALETVPYVDLKQYLGVWYEIARNPAPFQKDCVASRATYSERKDGKITVLNECHKGTFDGPLKQAEGVAKVVDTKTNSKLKVSFFLFFWGDYWIIDLDEEYRWAVVSEPNQKYLWILSRTPQMNEADYQGIISRLKEKGFDLSRLRPTPQPLS